MAFNVGCPSHFLSKESQDLIGRDEHFRVYYVLGRIIEIQVMMEMDASRGWWDGTDGTLPGFDVRWNVPVDEMEVGWWLLEWNALGWCNGPSGWIVEGKARVGGWNAPVSGMEGCRHPRSDSALRLDAPYRSFY